MEELLDFSTVSLGKGKAIDDIDTDTVSTIVEFFGQVLKILS